MNSVKTISDTRVRILVVSVVAVAVAFSIHVRAQVIPHDAELPQSISGNRMPEGYSVGNFGIAASLDASGLKILKSLVNPPVLGEWLEPFGSGELHLNVNGNNDFAVISRYSVFPENSSRLVSRSTGISAQIETFAPIRCAGDGHTSFNSFLPAIIVRVVLSNRSAKAQTVHLAYLLTPDKANSEGASETFDFHDTEILETHRKQGNTQVWLMAVPDTDAAVQDDQAGGQPQMPMNVGLSIHLEPRQSRLVSFVFGDYDSRDYTSVRLPSRRALELYLLGQGLQGQPKDLAHQYATFVAALPRTGDPQLDVYLRWYLSAAVLLTKGISNGNVLTMGYVELNQRDSFWTSGAHLIFWPDLEQKMLQESMSHQDPNGQIPMTILPIIRRANNIDGDEYFILRVARYYEWYRDDTFLKEALPHVKRAIDYLVSLDQEQTGIPMQVSFWADWKDVLGVRGRTYAPHFDLLWLATLKKAQLLAKAASDKQFETKLAALYAKAYKRANRSTTQGGLWDGTRYVDLWKDGRKVPYTLEDQTVAAIYGVIPRHRLESIYNILNQQNESPYGVRETYPYIASFKQEDYGPGEYHDGGIWPWLNFADAWGRFKNGHAADAERILKEVGYNDLVRFHDFVPNEFLNGETGRNEGEAPQGWDADFFSAIYFGAFGLARVSANQLDIHAHLSGNNNFTTTFRVPEGDLLLSRKDGRWEVTKKLTRDIRIKVIQ